MPKRQKRRVILWTLLTLIIIAAGYTFHRWRRHVLKERAIARLQAAGVFEVVRRDMRPVGPIWLQKLQARVNLRWLAKEHIWISSTNARDLDLVLVGQVDTISTLDLYCSEVTDAGLTHILRLPRLQYLNLTWAKVTDEGVRTLTDTFDLQGIVLADTDITDGALPHIAKMPSLEQLDVRKTRITDDGLRYLTKADNLRNLCIANTAVTDAGMECLAELTTLKQLDLSWTNVTDNGLAKLTRLQGLVLLNLCGTKVTDGGVKHLKELPSLQTANLTNTEITGDGITQLLQARPTLQIEIAAHYLSEPIDKRRGR